jgi:hypothetical protein
MKKLGCDVGRVDEVILGVPVGRDAVLLIKYLCSSVFSRG